MLATGTAIKSGGLILVVLLICSHAANVFFQGTLFLSLHLKCGKSIKE
jgi:hypothetical protein